MIKVASNLIRMLEKAAGVVGSNRLRQNPSSGGRRAEIAKMRQEAKAQREAGRQEARQSRIEARQRRTADRKSAPVTPAASPSWSPPQGALAGKDPSGREFYIPKGGGGAVYRDGGKSAPSVRERYYSEPAPQPKPFHYINPNSPEGRLVRDNVLSADALAAGRGIGQGLYRDLEAERRQATQADVRRQMQEEYDRMAEIEMRNYPEQWAGRTPSPLFRG
jgi:hypothetical protein